jgi:hypothetical protein
MQEYKSCICKRKDLNLKIKIVELKIKTIEPNPKTKNHLYPKINRKEIKSLKRKANKRIRKQN